VTAAAVRKKIESTLDTISQKLEEAELADSQGAPSSFSKANIILADPSTRQRFFHVEKRLDRLLRCYVAPVHAGFLARFNWKVSRWIRGASGDWRSVEPTIKQLGRRVTEFDYLAALVSPSTPSKDLDATVRYVIECEWFRKSWVQSALRRAREREPELEIWRNSRLRTLPSAAYYLGKPLKTTMELRRLRKESIMRRGVFAPRGSLWQNAELEQPALIADLAGGVDRSSAEQRSEIALSFGQWGGPQEAQWLCQELVRELAGRDESYQIDLVSALSNVGGPTAVEGLLHAADTGSERVRTSALVGLESLASDGAVSLMDSPEPVTITSKLQEEAFRQVAARLKRLTEAQEAPEYARHKAKGVLELVNAALGVLPIGSRSGVTLQKR
jgi:hypothetical protein